MWWWIEFKMHTVRPVVFDKLIDICTVFTTMILLRLSFWYLLLIMSYNLSIFYFRYNILTYDKNSCATEWEAEKSQYWIHVRSRGGLLTSRCQNSIFWWGRLASLFHIFASGDLVQTPRYDYTHIILQILRDLSQAWHRLLCHIGKSKYMISTIKPFLEHPDQIIRFI